MPWRTLLKIIFILLYLTDYNSCSSSQNLMLFVFDGFRHDFLQPNLTPNMWLLAKRGVLAQNGLVPQFPTSTLTNLYSLVSGLNTDNHGIVGDTFYDPVLGETWDYWNDKNEEVFETSRQLKWFTGTPIWEVSFGKIIKNAEKILFLIDKYLPI